MSIGHEASAKHLLAADANPPAGAGPGAGSTRPIFAYDVASSGTFGVAAGGVSALVAGGATLEEAALPASCDVPGGAGGSEPNVAPADVPAGGGASVGPQANKAIPAATKSARTTAMNASRTNAIPAR
ncbi:MAG: hypothetical protein HOV80_11910 [Polyangiaceae bacterium]|nr:hypothetical protein [Polyangiaceae bacterium]